MRGATRSRARRRTRGRWFWRARGVPGLLPVISPTRANLAGGNADLNLAAATSTATSCVGPMRHRREAPVVRSEWYSWLPRWADRCAERSGQVRSWPTRCALRSPVARELRSPQCNSIRMARRVVIGSTHFVRGSSRAAGISMQLDAVGSRAALGYVHCVRAGRRVTRGGAQLRLAVPRLRARALPGVRREPAG
jgi:hypothetical protein